MENTGTSSSLTEKSILITFITTNILFWNLYSSRGNIAAIVARRRMRTRPHLQRELKVYFQQNKAKESKPPINNTWIAIQSFREENNPTELNKYDIERLSLTNMASFVLPREWLLILLAYEVHIVLHYSLRETMGCCETSTLLFIKHV